MQTAIVEFPVPRAGSRRETRRAQTLLTLAQPLTTCLARLNLSIRSYLSTGLESKNGQVAP